MSACSPYASVNPQVLMPGQSGNPTPPQSQQQPPGTPTSLQHGGGGSGSPSAAGTPGMVSAAGLGGPSPVAGGPPPPPHHVCCESGRPMLTDPLTGQTMCSCQYDAQLLNYQRLAASGLPLNMYGTAAAAAAAAAAAYGGEQGFLPLGATEQSAFYSPSANGFDLKENLEAWRTLQPYAASMYYPYESAALAGYPFANGYGVDLNGARRKNATRETTATLKAWLSEHRKNPYPTKGEKIMLAIITKMTLTQVSTWFANARRRLKKENKMTWSPRNRCDDDDDDEDARPSRDPKDNGSVASSGGKSTDGLDSVYRKPSGGHDSADLHRQYNPHSLHRKEDDDRLKDDLDDLRNGLVDIDDDSKSSDPGLLRGMHHGSHLSGHHRLQGSSAGQRSIRVSSNDKNSGSSPGAASDGLGSPAASDSESSQTSLLSPSTPVHDGRGGGGATDIQSPNNPKPRIWSIVDTATSGTPGTTGPQNGIPIPASRSAVESLNSLQRARLDYLSTYQKQGVGAPSWYGTTAGPGSGGPPPGSSFPLYACSPMVSSTGLPSGSPGAGVHPPNSGHLGVGAGAMDSSQSAAAAAVAASLNRLRTVHGFGSDMNAASQAGGGPGKSNVSSFSFVTSSSRLHPTMTTAASSSGGSSSSAIAAVAGSLGINPMASIANRVVS